MEEDSYETENKDNLQTFRTMMRKHIPKHYYDPIEESLSPYLSNFYTKDATIDLAYFIVRLWTSAKWTDNDVENFQLRFIGCEEFIPVIKMFQNHDTYKFIFHEQNKQEEPQEEFHICSYSNYGMVTDLEEIEIETARSDRCGVFFLYECEISEGQPEIVPEQFHAIKSIIMLAQTSHEYNDLNNIIIELEGKDGQLWRKYGKKENSFASSRFKPGLFPPHISSGKIRIIARSQSKSKFRITIMGVSYTEEGLKHFRKKIKSSMKDPSDYGFVPYKKCEDF